MKLPWSTSVNELDSLNPIKVALFVGSVTVLMILLAVLLSSDPQIAWNLATIGWLFFAWLSAVISFFNKNWMRYTLWSLVLFIVLGGIYYFTASFLSPIELDAMPEYQSIFAAIIIFNGVAIVMSRVIRGMTEFFNEH